MGTVKPHSIVPHVHTYVADGSDASSFLSLCHFRQSAKLSSDHRRDCSYCGGSCLLCPCPTSHLCLPLLLRVLVHGSSLFRQQHSGLWEVVTIRPSSSHSNVTGNVHNFQCSQFSMFTIFSYLPMYTYLLLE